MNTQFCVAILSTFLTGCAGTGAGPVAIETDDPVLKSGSVFTAGPVDSPDWLYTADDDQASVEAFAVDDFERPGVHFATVQDAEGGHHDLPSHHLSLFVGLGVETKEQREDEAGFALGLEYGLRFHENWSVGAVVELLGQDTIRNVLLVAPVSFYPGGGNLRLVAGPGFEFTRKKDKFAVRVGVGYEIDLTGHWSLSPEFFVDLVETGEATYIGGLALGYGF